MTAAGAVGTVPERCAAVIERAYRTGVVTGSSGRVHELKDAIDAHEGRFLADLVRQDPTIVRTLEVGCAFGLSSLYLCGALAERPGASHTIVDPFQSTDWDSVGRRQLDEAGVTFASFIESGSELALPRLCEQAPGAFDFIFVDGWHTFDHTLVDCFYATRLLRVGGYLVVDDTGFPSVRRAVDFVGNYPCFSRAGSVTQPRPKSAARRVASLSSMIIPRGLLKRLLPRPAFRRVFEDDITTMIALKKVQADDRPWNWHDDDF
jgi:predicted O-methyltransferase YrrM